MTGLEGIPVHIQTAPYIGANAQALLDNGRGHSIDLRSLPLAPGELEYLKQTLGRGEVHVEIDALGKSEVQETAYRGIWWVTHRNALDDVMAEFIEVSFCPDIVHAQRDDVRESLEALRQTEGEQP